MDIYEYLKRDHRKVDKLFNLLETAPTKKNRVETFELLQKELSLHAEAEAAIFYKALAKYSKHTSLVEHAKKDHDQILNKLAVIESHINEDNIALKSIEDLKKVVEHHVADEEGKIFKEAKKVLPVDQSYLLKEKMHFLKGKLLLGSELSEKEKELIE